MRSIQKPGIAIKSIIRDCVSNMRGSTNKYTDAIEHICRQSKLLDTKMKALDVGAIEVHEMVTDRLTKDDMVRLYRDKFSKQGQPGREYYDQLILLAPNGTCPLCGISNASTLDHYMAKTLYPVFAVSPRNLVPACKDCNTVRGTVVFMTAADMTLHPYYDEVQSFDWLEARIIPGDTPSVEYYVSEQIEDAVLRSRLEKHLDVFQLKQRYANKAVEEIIAHQSSFAQLLRIGGKDILIAHLQLIYTSCHAAEKNSWRTALYKALIVAEQ